MAYNSKTNTNIHNKKRLTNSDSFLEALRDLGSGITDSIARDVIQGVPEEAFKQISGRKSGELKPNKPLFLSETRESFSQDFLDIRRQERLIWSQKEQQTKLQIAAILEELKKLTQTTKNLAKEVEVASQQVPVEPGVYHVSFFEKLRQTLILFRKKIEESVTWLSAFNQKAKKRNFYWAQVRKSGTKFMLSQERYMATQAG